MSGVGQQNYLSNRNMSHISVGIGITTTPHRASHARRKKARWRFAPRCSPVRPTSVRVRVRPIRRPLSLSLARAAVRPFSRRLELQARTKAAEPERRSFDRNDRRKWLFGLLVCDRQKGRESGSGTFGLREQSTKQHDSPRVDRAPLRISTRAAGNASVRAHPTRPSVDI